ncbi:MULTISPECIES: pathogenicity island protein [Staphylococcus]|uniref:pathogenicity island protein n=1 Tax=Staphylococcus TaxID=1279 RepID=UPI002DBF8EF4|nr:pathogenicity island protein [Staphylococcus pasteuri]MEB6208189.1 pathogenicity island protein [Staphylococcus pasteuri]
MQAVKEDYNLDEQAIKVGLIVGVSNEIYFRSISHVSDIFIEYIKDQWVAWRESYIPKTNKRTSHKLIATGNFDFVLARTKSYLNYIKKNRRN